MSGNQSQVNAGNGGNNGDAPEDLAAGQVSINSAGSRTHDLCGFFCRQAHEHRALSQLRKAIGGPAASSARCRAHQN